MPPEGLPRIARLVAPSLADDPVTLARLARRCPRVPVSPTPDGGLRAVTARVSGWLADPLAMDRALHEAEGDLRLQLVIEGTPGALLRDTPGLLVRYQRLLAVFNRRSDTPTFRRVLERHRALHDLARPLVRADHDHAIDTWQWVLRLDPHADVGVQLAALLHDIERLESEADARVEHLAPDYQAFKEAHARRGADRAAQLLSGCGLGGPAVDDVARLIATHERPGPDPSGALLADADALSFFALNSPGYLGWFGPEQTARKVAWTLRRMSPRARRHLRHVRLQPAIARMLSPSGVR